MSFPNFTLPPPLRPSLHYFPSYFYYYPSHFNNFPYFKFHIFQAFHTSDFPDIFRFHISQSSNFLDISIFFFQVSILSIFPIPTFVPTLSHIQIVTFLSSHSIPKFSQISPTEQVLFHSNFVPSR